MDFSYNHIDVYDSFVYSDGHFRYCEWLYKGILWSCGFITGGPYWRTDGSHLKLPDREEMSAFVVELDGMSLVDHWEYVGNERSDENNSLTVKVHLRHKIAGTDIWVCTLLDGSGCISRWLEIKNSSDHAAALTRLAVMSGKLEYMETWKGKLRESHDTPYRLGYFENSEWTYEGQFRWHELHSDIYSFGGRYNRFRYRHPFCVLENRAFGTTYAVQMAYSGGYRFSFDFRYSPSGEGILAFSSEVDGLKPIRMIGPGETVRSPEILISKAQGDLDQAVQQMHSHIRNIYLPESFRGRAFIENSGGGNVESDKKYVDRSVEAGFDIYYRDANWFSEQPGSFLDYVGDWDSNKELYPKGYSELSEYCRSKGIRVGLWMEPERVGKLSKRMESDRDMFMRDEEDNIIRGELEGVWFYIGESGFYNLSRKEVCDRIESDICRVIEENGINFFRLDCNIDYYAPWAMNWENGHGEAVDFRYHENLYGMWKRIREKYPDVVFENCASGGGRTDLGMTRYFDHTWISDNGNAPKSFTIFNGMSMCLPPEFLSALNISAPVDEDYYLMLAMFTRPSIYDNEKARRFIEIYKTFARPFLPRCRLYHHTPSFDTFDATGAGVLEAAAEDGTKDMIGIFCNYDPGESERLLKCKGINASYDYRVTDFRTGEKFTVSGYELKYRGLSVPLRGALTSELLMMEKI